MKKNKIWILLMVVPLVLSMLVSCQSLKTEVSATSTSVPSMLTNTPHINDIPVPDQISDPQEKIMNHYLNNGGCEFPCWWGIEPGKTTIQQVKQEFSLFADIYETTETKDGLQYYSISFNVPENINRYLDDNWEIHLKVKNDIVQIITAYSELTHMFSSQTVYTFLQELGKPTEIWIVLFPNMIEPPVYRLFLFYPEQGVLLGWSGNTEIISETDHGITVSICPQNYFMDIDLVQFFPAFFFFWLPDNKLTFDEINENYFANEPYHLLSDQNSNMDVEKFYETYLNPTTDKCLTFSYP